MERKKYKQTPLCGNIAEVIWLCFSLNWVAADAQCRVHRAKRKQDRAAHPQITCEHTTAASAGATCPCALDECIAAHQVIRKTLVCTYPEVIKLRCM